MPLRSQFTGRTEKGAAGVVSRVPHVLCQWAFRSSSYVVIPLADTLSFWSSKLFHTSGFFFMSGQH